MLVRVAATKDVAIGQMRFVDVAGAKVSLADADGHVFAFAGHRVATCGHVVWAAG